MYLTEILARCSQIEGRVGRLYRTLAKTFQHNGGVAKLWHELALEEETHADILRRELRSFEEQDDSGPFLPDYTERLEHVNALLTELEARIPTLESFDEALAFAIAIEQTELESLYDDLVTQGHPAFRLISERIEAALTARPAPTVPGIPNESQPGVTKSRGR